MSTHRATFPQVIRPCCALPSPQQMLWRDHSPPQRPSAIPWSRHQAVLTMQGKVCGTAETLLTRAQQPKKPALKAPQPAGVSWSRLRCWVTVAWSAPGWEPGLAEPM